MSEEIEYMQKKIEEVGWERDYHKPKQTHNGLDWGFKDLGKIEYVRLNKELVLLNNILKVITQQTHRP